MNPRVEGRRPRKARGWRASDQARPAVLVLALAVLAACGGRGGELSPAPFLGNLFGAHLAGREPPPGADGPWPTLSSVPPRPAPPDPAMRESISAGLAADRAQSRTPLGLPGQRPGAAAAGLAAGPPPPPRLAAMPPLRLDPAPVAAPVPATTPAAATPAVAAPTPAAPPPAPARDLLAPPPPTRDLLAPPPPPGRDLLAPRRD